MARPGKEIRWDVLNGGWSADFSWMLGLTFGDGNIYKSYKNCRVSLSGNKNELDLLEKWRSLICPKAKIRKVTESGVEVYFGSRLVVEWFEKKWGLCGDKMQCLKFPSGKIPKEYLNHFVRGLIDSDGSVYIENRKRMGLRGNNPLRISFSSSVNDFTSDLNKVLTPEGLPRVSVSKSKKKDKYSKRIYTQYKLSWSGSSALKVANWLYKDSSPNNRGDKGYEVYQSYLKIRDEIDKPCACGRTPILKESGLCRTCLAEKKREENPRPPCKFECGRISEFRDICNACYKRIGRANGTVVRKTQGTCSCGSLAYRRNMCDKCYKRWYVVQKVS
jgi:hypothetical protein